LPVLEHLDAGCGQAFRREATLELGEQRLGILLAGEQTAHPGTRPQRRALTRVLDHSGVLPGAGS
jgi:hypothetical protein